MLILIEHISREKSRSAVSRSWCHANEIISPGCALFLADSWTNGRMRRRDRAPHFPLLAPGPTPLTRSLSLPETEDGRSAASPIGQGDAEKALEEKSLALTSSESLADYCSCMQPTSQSSATSELKEKVSSVASTAPRGACPIAASLPDSWSRAASQKSVHPGFFYVGVGIGNAPIPDSDETRNSWKCRPTPFPSAFCRAAPMGAGCERATLEGSGSLLWVGTTQTAWWGVYLLQSSLPRTPSSLQPPQGTQGWSP
jgi:hypothetical protein